MVLLLHNLFHIPFQMLFQQFPISLLIKQPGKEPVHIVQHILQRLIQPSCINQRRPEHIQIHTGIILKGKQRGIYILDIDLRLLHIFRGQPLKSINKNGRIIRYHNIRCQCVIILNLLQPTGSKQPVQNTGGRCLQHVKLRLVLFALQLKALLRIHIAQDLNAGFPRQKVIIVLVFFIYI